MVPAPAWHLFGWPGVVGIIILVLATAAFVVLYYWHEPGPPARLPS